jgi:PilZ domain
VSRLRRYLGNRRKHRRAKVRLTFTLSLSDPRTSSNGARRVPSLDGHTLDISETGMALVVPAIRIGGHYLVGNERKLHLQLELPGGPLEMRVTPVRYESLEDDPREMGYLIGARITEMNASERARFDEYLKTALKNQTTG